MRQHEPKLERALRSLRAQGIPVSQAIVGDQGFVFAVMGFMLTAIQINDLLDIGHLTQAGIREFARRVEGDPTARLRLPSEVIAAG